MNNEKKTDAFTFHILKNIDKKTLDTFSPAQLSAVKEAIRATQRSKKHPFDIRGVINLFFAKYYFVLFMGRDRRISTKEAEFDRRHDIALLGNIAFLFFMIVPFILLILIFLYVLKVFAGIDLIPDVHMGRILGL